jgi:hypothetical protein
MKLEHAIAALILGTALIVGAIPDAVRAQPSAAAVAPGAVDKATMDRERAISRHLSVADRARAGKLFEDGYNLGLANNFDEARTDFEAGLAIDPANALANSMFGFLLLQHDQFDAGRDRLTRTVYFAPKSDEAAEAKKALAKLAEADAKRSIKVDMSGACRPLVENFLAAAQKSDGAAAKAGYDALHEAGGCGIANGPLLTADDEAAVSASVAAQGGSGPTAAGTAASFVRYISLGLQIGQELEAMREEFAAAVNAGAIRNPFAAGSKNPFTPVSLPPQAAAGSPGTGKPPAKTVPGKPAPGTAGTPAQTPAQAMAGQMPASCAPTMQKYLDDVGSKQSGGAVSSYQQLASSGECRDAMQRIAADNSLDLPERHMAPLTRNAFGAAFAKDPNAPLAAPTPGYAGSSGGGDDVDPQEVLEFGIALLNLGIGAANLANAMHGAGAMIPTTNFNSLAGPIIRNGVGQGAPTRAPTPPPRTFVPCGAGPVCSAQ